MRITLFALALIVSNVLVPSGCLVQIDLCNNYKRIGQLFGFSSSSVTIVNQICGTSSAQPLPSCGSLNSHLPNILLCAIGAKQCNINTSNQNQLAQIIGQLVPSAVTSAPQLQEYLNNPLSCAIIQQSCCLTESATDTGIANTLLQAITSQKLSIRPSTVPKMQNPVSNLISIITGIFARK